LSNILKTFNEQFGTLFTDSDRVAKRIRDDIAPKVAADAAYQNAKENTPHTARMAHDEALGKVMQHLLKDDTQVSLTASPICCVNQRCIVFANAKRASFTSLTPARKAHVAGAV
ncbi:MAG: hypothetical protein ACREDL_24670, partial [Bradyrhizobium sp.]